MKKLEKAFIELLGNENFPHHLGNTLSRASDEVLIEEDLIAYLLAKYENKQLTQTEAKSIVLQLKTLPASDLYESNLTIMRWLSDGFILKREDRNQKDIHIGDISAFAWLNRSFEPTISVDHDPVASQVIADFLTFGFGVSTFPTSKSRIQHDGLIAFGHCVFGSLKWPNRQAIIARPNDDRRVVIVLLAFAGRRLIGIVF